MDIKQIKHVAIYLRKSRGDEENVLLHHKNRLTETAHERGWTYDIFEEDILSGERISTRPKMKKLLCVVEEGLYDGVLVTEYQRLSRGNSKDFGELIEVLQYSNTFIITPDRIYDVNDTNDLTMLGIQGVFSHTELRIIVGRLIGGKRDGAKEGNWVNGKPPFPYQYVKKIIIDEKGKEKVIGEIIINQEKEKIYNLIKETYLKGDTGTQQIAIMLNKQGIQSPYGSTWHNNQIKRLLIHEFHLGQVIYGKKEWKKTRDNKKRVTKVRDESEWFTGIGKHRQLKTYEEHSRILEILARNNKIPNRSRQGCFPTTGIMYCKKCGHRMSYSIGRQESKSGLTFDYTKCSYINPYGEKCQQKGVKMNDNFYSALFDNVINNYLDESHIQKINQIKNEESSKYELAKIKETELLKAEKVLVKINEAYLADAYTAVEYAKLKKDQEVVIRKLKSEIIYLRDNDNVTVRSKSELKAKINKFKKEWFSTTNSNEKNLLLKSIINKIYYDRIGDQITFEIEYI